MVMHVHTLSLGRAGGSRWTGIWGSGSVRNARGRSNCLKQWPLSCMRRSRCRGQTQEKNNFMSEKIIKHFNKANVWGRVDGVPTRKLSKEGKGRPYWRLKVTCPSSRGNVLAYGRLWNKEKAEALIDYLKKNPSAGIKLVGFFNQYDDMEEHVRRSNFTWYDWQPDPCADPRAAFVLVGKVEAVKDDVLVLQLNREGSDPEDFEVYALTPSALKGIIEDDIV